jgi:hypothetical protein
MASYSVDSFAHIYIIIQGISPMDIAVKYGNLYWIRLMKLHTVQVDETNKVSVNSVSIVCMIRKVTLFWNKGYLYS